MMTARLRLGLITGMLAIATVSQSGAIEIGAGGGVFSPFDGSSGVAVVAQIFGDNEDSNWRLGGEFSYRDFETEVFGVKDVSTQAYRIAGIAHYRFYRDWIAVPYVGATISASINVIDGDKVEAAMPGALTISSVGGGVGFGGIFGADIPIGERFSLFGEGRVGYDLQLSSRNGSIDTENLGGISGLAGIRFRF